MHNCTTKFIYECEKYDGNDLLLNFIIEAIF